MSNEDPNRSGVNIAAFRPGPGADKRIDLDRVHGAGITFDVAVTDFKEATKVAMNHDRVYLRALTKMLQEHGYSRTAEQLYPYGMHLFSPQPLLLVQDFDVERDYSLDHFDHKETTTSYKFDFNFITPAIGGNPVEIPLYFFDSKAIGVLTSRGVRPLLENYMKSFMKMAQLSEHDGTSHQTLFHQQHNAFIATSTEVEGMKGPKPEACSGKFSEDHALALHAQIVKRMFDDSPIRKKHVLKYASETFQTLAEMQKQAIAAVPEDKSDFLGLYAKDQKNTIREAIAYLAQVYYHRLARVISPEDPDLTKPIILRDGEPPVMSVAEAADTLRGVAGEKNDHLCIAGQEEKDTLATLEAQAAQGMHDTYLYRAIHKLNSFPVTFTRGKPDIKMFDAVDTIAAVHGLQKKPAAQRNYASYAERVDDAINGKITGGR